MHPADVEHKETPCLTARFELHFEHGQYGYRVKSAVATQFRIWATQRLREYIVKGFTLDDERLKNPDQPFDYFEELTRRIQDIRTSERRFYQKITDIYATSIDYDPTLSISIDFFKTVQNKMHWAITGQTAAEIIYKRADAGPHLARDGARPRGERIQQISRSPHRGIKHRLVGFRQDGQADRPRQEKRREMTATLAAGATEAWRAD